MTYKREMPGSPFPIGLDEEVIMEIDFGNWGTPSSPSAKLYDTFNEHNEVTSTMLSGSASASGDVVTTPTIKLLEEGVVYLLIVQATISSQKLSCYAELEAQR